MEGGCALDVLSQDDIDGAIRAGAIMTLNINLISFVFLAILASFLCL